MDILGYNGVCSNNIAYYVKGDTVEKNVIVFQGYLIHLQTLEECKIRFSIDDTGVMCKGVYRNIRGVPHYLFMMSEDSIPVEFTIDRILKDIGISYKGAIKIPEEFCVQKRMKKRVIEIKEEVDNTDFSEVYGNWEDDNVSSK